jgi:citrate synthase
MQVGRQHEAPYTAIATSDAHGITVRGKDLCGELIGQVGFVDYFLFLVLGHLPDENQRFFTDAVTVAIAEHGLTPSVQAARMTYDAAPEALQAAVAAGILGCGSVVVGSAETCGRLLSRLVERARASGEPFDSVALSGLRELRQGRQAVPGFGHMQHVDGDPRSARLLDLARRRGAAGEHLRMLLAIEAAVPTVLGRALVINVSGAIAAVMLDVGFPLEVLKGLPILARTAGIIAHLYEESRRPIGFLMSHFGDAAITYDGPAAQPGAGAVAEGAGGRR